MNTLREYMNAAGISSVRELATRSGVSRRSLEQYSCGRYPWSNARGKLLVAVADALGIHPRKLIELDQE